MRFRFISLSTRLAACALVALACALGLLGPTAPPPTHADEVYGTFHGRALGQSVTFERNDRSRPSWSGTLDFVLDDGAEFKVFCIQMDVAVRTGDRYRNDGPVEILPNGCSIRYILDNYPGSTADSEAEGAARQMAVWHFSDGVDLATIAEANADVRERALAIASDAAAGACPQRRTEPPNLRLEPASSVARTGRRIPFIVTAGGQDAGQTVHVVVTGPAILDDGSRQAALELDLGGVATFGVTGTAPGDTEVRVELAYHLGAGTVFSHVDEERPTQRLVLAEHVDLVASAVSNATWEESPTTTPVPATPVATASATTHTAPTVTPMPTITAVSATATGADPTVTAHARQETPGAPPQPTEASEPRMPERLPGTGVAQAPSGAALLAATVLAAMGWLGRRATRRE